MAVKDFAWVAWIANDHSSDRVIATSWMRTASRKTYISPGRVRLYSICGGIVVANLYYNQPLLSLIATSFGVRQASAGIIPALTQAGYATGLFFLVPLSDYVNPRRLLTTIVFVVAAALVAGAMSPSIFALQAASFVIGVFSIVPQILLPLAAAMSDPSRRGRTIGTMMAGLLTGILLSRTLSGFVGRWFGWRTMYAAGAAMMVVAAVFIATVIPSRSSTRTFHYGEVLRSLFHIARSEPVLREVSFIGAMAFGAFSAFWSTLAFLLAEPPWRMSSDVVGLFGAVGVVGVMTAPIIGRMSDRRSPRRTSAIGLGILLLSFFIFLAGQHSLAAIVAGVILLDLGLQTSLVSNQARMYAISTDLAGRLNTIFMTSCFLGGALGSALASFAWMHARWNGVCGVAMAMLLCAFFPYGQKRLAPARASRP
jgi:predicted MFS family arabinose efflux permease